MNVEQLIAELQQQPKDAEVFVALGEDGGVNEYLTIDALRGWTPDENEVALHVSV